MKCKNTWLLNVFLTLITLSTFAQSDGVSFQEHREEYVHELIKAKVISAEDSVKVTFYAPDESYRVMCKFKSAKGGEPFEIPTSAGTTKTYQKFGELRFKLNGKKLRLAVYRSLALAKNPIYRDYLFVPFKDATSGTETYGGGRYLDIQMSDFQGNKVELDFNLAYNPYCAFTEGYSCPIPPEENHLKVPIKAGEKAFEKEY